VKLAQDVLAYGRSDEAPPQRAQIPLAAAVEAAGEDAGLSPDGVRLSLDVPTALEVSADPDQLHRIMVNLFRNGRQAIEAAETAQVGVIRVSASAADGLTTIRFADNGPGVPERVQANLFQPFMGSGRTGGAGLGLAIARELARGHGGDLVLAESSPEGAVFRLTLAAPGEADG
jgi:signal transduction histidine kinase